MLVVWLALAIAAPQADVEAGLLRKIPVGTPIVIARGETVLVEIAGPLRVAPEGTEIESLPTMTSRPSGVTLLAWTEETGIRPGRAAATVWTHAILRADPRAPLGEPRISARVDVMEQSRNLAILALEGTVKIIEATPTLAAIDHDKTSYSHFDERALQSARLVTSMQLERLEMPPRALTLQGSEKLAMQAFLVARLRAEAAKDHLRAAADSTDDAISAAAITALAGAADPPPKLGSRPAPLPEPVRALEQGMILFDRYDLEGAYRVLYRARLTPGLPAARLPEALVRIGAIEAARGSSAVGTDLIGQALCLSPTLPSPSARPPMSRAFDEVKRRSRCPHALSPHEATAQAATTDEGPVVVVRALFGPDPYHAIERGTVEVLDPSGAVRSLREVAATRGDLASIEAPFGPKEVGDTSAGVRIRARAFDLAGIELSSSGAQEPLVLQVAVEPEHELEITWWMWAAGGAFVIVGGAAVIAAATSRGEPGRAIGPIDVRF